MTEYYKDKLEQGLKYQDFVCDQLRKMTPAKIIMPYCSRDYQWQGGESASGYEIKFDGRMSETGNVYIEIAEKSDPNIDGWTESGIYRDDNTVYYLIGDYDKAYIFSKYQLKRLLSDRTEEELARKGIRRVQINTSQGFLIPCGYLENDPNGKFYCLEYLKFTT